MELGGKKERGTPLSVVVCVCVCVCVCVQLRQRRVKVIQSLLSSGGLVFFLFFCFSRSLFPPSCLHVLSFWPSVE